MIPVKQQTDKHASADRAASKVTGHAWKRKVSGTQKGLSPQAQPFTHTTKLLGLMWSQIAGVPDFIQIQASG